MFNCVRCGYPLQQGAVQTPSGWMHGQCAGPPAYPPPPSAYGPPPYPYAGAMAPPAPNADVLPTWWIVLLYATSPLICVHAPISIVARVLYFTWRSQYPNKARQLRKHQLLSSLITFAIFGLFYLVFLKS